MSIKLKELAFAYQQRKLFSDLSGELSPGAVHFLAGPNGSGKSTLLKLMCGYLKPANGTIKFNNKLLEKYSGADRARMLGVLHQNVQCELDFTLYEMIFIIASGRFPRLKKISATDRVQVDELLERFELKNLSKSLFRELSGGERQRALIAGLLLLEPDFLLLDEPTSALDPAWRNKIFAALEEYASDHTVLVVTHDLELLGRARGTIWLLDNGGNFYSGSADKMLDRELFGKVYNTTSEIEKQPGKPVRIYFD